ncbi:MAG TPA: RagB/SusD family nutrient uptake outer membrane protein [Flavobacteriaceae bacterium]|nr:RagB/SusD family nutrient uptake outer membrane protein [Flavobacteriaceae bacterium]MCB9212908.1 RagB/SusD family nutrient uptake outer membrane protein [Alteromonas sp.]HPF11420.1 RagB/SusD family nutrient uptake outer membrane protein [Flavobacteriaceae bacterium]HQU20583.1 RagB/SusD family nutrient uptake outer membrane protein [Flavobacteriaceae bacterium]HQU65094.1 RagB/SusD family nutrient uptake outer membrane protein [Flavobacteriaceae bacterium]
MRKISTIFMFVVALGLFTSCDNNLDQLPFDEFATDNAFITAQDFENGIRGVYLQLTAGGFYGGSDAGSMLSAPDVMSDNATLSQYGRTTKRTLHNFQYNANSTLLGTYRNCYRLIYQANQILLYAESFEGESKDNIVGEAKALRALAHFNLVAYFGKIPTQSNDANSSLGIAYVTDADVTIEPSRMTVQETYAMILDDLLDAKSKINASNPEGRLNKNGVNLLLSRVYLYMGQWQNAIDAANAVSTQVAARANVVGVWEDTSEDGLVFWIPNDAPTLGNNIGVTWSQGGVTSLIPEYVASFELTNLYDDGNDIRKDAYIFAGSVTSQGITTNFNGIKKLFARPGGQPGVVDYKILRAAEAFLNKAEAYYNLGNESAARQALDAVRSKRYLTPPSGETGAALLDAIRLERRLEFAFEYQRFFDLKRWGLPVQRSNAGDVADGSGTPSDVLSLPAGSNKFQLPIAQESLDVNPNLQQNPGY